jgi:hypothetical protein
MKGFDDMTSGVRERAAAGLEGAADRLQSVAESVEGGLPAPRRAPSSPAASRTSRTSSTSSTSSTASCSS